MVDAPKINILAELNELRTVIQRVASEVGAVRHPLIDEDRLGAAAQELHAVVSATEGATNGILETAEAIGNVAGELEANDDPAVTARAGKIADLVAELFTHCSFQDITGQRISKVVGTLEFVEQRITRIIDELGSDNFSAPPVTETTPEDDESKLLNGPQSGGVSQNDIDRLFD